MLLLNPCRYTEDSIVRHIEPTHAGHLELRRLSNFVIRLVRAHRALLCEWHAQPLPALTRDAPFLQIPTPNPAVHVYEAVPKAEEADIGGLKSPMRGEQTSD